MRALCSGGVVLCLLVFFSANAAAGEEDIPQQPKEKPPFSTLLIKYRLAGSKNGEETVYYNGTSGKVAIEENSELRFGKLVNTTHMLSIYDGKKRTSLVAGEKRAVSAPFTDDIIHTFYGVPMNFAVAAGTGTVLDRECQVYTMPSGSSYYWQGILLKETPNNLYGFSREAVLLEIDTPLPPEKFALPDGVMVITPEQVRQEEEKAMWALKKSLEEKAVTDPDLQQILKTCTKKSGALDMGKYYREIKKYERAQRLKQALDKK